MAIVVKNLCKSFGSGDREFKAVDNLSFSVKKGEFYGLLGANGAGKSTTINMLTGLLEKDSGSIRILGKNPEDDWEYVRNRVNVSTAYFPMSDSLSVRQNLRVFAGFYGVANREDKINDLLGKFELSSLADKKMNLLSSGEKARAVLCKGLINDPQVLFLDEATVGLDPDIAEKTRNVLIDYQRANDATVLFTSHYMFEVEELCDRIAFMQNGKIVKVDTAKNLKKLIKKQTVEISVRGGSSELRKFLRAEGIDILYSYGNTLVFETTAARDEIYKTVAKIFKSGFRLSDLHIKKPTIDDIFIKFAREKK